VDRLVYIDVMNVDLGPEETPVAGKVE